MGARFHWPELGRFIQQDPAGDGMNWYAYVGNQPTAATDPEGLWPGFAKCRAYVDELQRQFTPMEANDKRKHCVVSCKLAKKCGPAFATAVGIAKEVADAFGEGDADWGDLCADKAGIDAAAACADDPKKRQCADECSKKCTR